MASSHTENRILVLRLMHCNSVTRLHLKKLVVRRLLGARGKSYWGLMAALRGFVWFSPPDIFCKHPVLRVLFEIQTAQQDLFSNQQRAKKKRKIAVQNASFQGPHHVLQRNTWTICSEQAGLTGSTMRRITLPRLNFHFSATIMA